MFRWNAARMNRRVARPVEPQALRLGIGRAPGPAALADTVCSVAGRQNAGRGVDVDTKFKYVCDAYSIEYSGSEEFLESRLPAIVREFADLSDKMARVPRKELEEEANNALPGLAVFLNEQPDQSQVNKFLAAAAWLQLSQGKNELRTGDVTEAIREHHHIPPGNSSDCLSKNIKKGYCQKLAKNPIRFQVTSAGMARLGLSV